MGTGERRPSTSRSIGRRQFLQAAGAMGTSLLLVNLRPAPGAATEGAAGQAAATGEPVSYGSWQDLYRDEWKWDRVGWGSHSNQCFPGGCSFRVYARDGVVWREEQTARSHASGPDYPDYNPQGCQKGCGFHHVLTSGERVRYPMKRAGERGEGKWTRIGWDEALGDIADAILDAHESEGPESVLMGSPHIHAGTPALSGAVRLTRLLNAVMPDLNVGIGDDLKGLLQTFGKMHLGYTADNFFDAELIFLTNTNPSYTWPSAYHFLSEARYNGSEIVLLSPDVNPSSPVADIQVPLRVGTDAAFWLGICQVIIAEGWYQTDFMAEQTDLPLLVRADTGRYLRASDLNGGSAEQLYVFDRKAERIVEAPRGTLEFGGEPALEGAYRARLRDGREVEVRPAFELLRDKLNDQYTPEQAAALCNVHPDVLRGLAKKVATKRTCSFIGFTSAKQYHGDLMERSLLLAMALTGNWGKPGTGFNCFLIPDTGFTILGMMNAPVHRFGLERLALPMAGKSFVMKMKDRSLSDELVKIALETEGVKEVGSVLPTPFMYNHAGYADLWDRREWQDPELKRNFGEYLREAVERGYWDEELLRPRPQQTPQVMMVMAHNPLRRERSARQTYLKTLFPKLKMVFAIETRLSTTAMYCDIVLPAAWYYEKTDLTFTFGLNPYTCLIEKSVEPQGEAREEWAIFAGLATKIEERAAARGLQTFRDIKGNEQRYAKLRDRFTMRGHLEGNEDVVRELVKICEVTGTFPKDYDYEQLREQGQVRIAGFGKGYVAEAIANEVPTDKPLYGLRKHVEEKRVYPTYARRAQFYLDHEWFLEAGEALPTHKETPPIGGGEHPFRLVSGHVRGSIHSLQAATPHFMRLHRGQPVLFLNDRVAAERGIEDGETIRMFNDVDEIEIMVSTTAAVGPDQVLVYMWEPVQFKDWKSHDSLLVGMPKSLQLAGDYGQFRYVFTSGSPSPSSDRGLRVDIAKISDRARAMAGTSAARVPA